MESPLRPTVRDVAAAAGVSKSLVSLAYKDPSKVSAARLKRIRAAAQQLGYSPNFFAQSLSQQGAPLIGIMLADLYNPLYPEIADAARSVFSRADRYSMIMSAALPQTTESTTLTTDKQIVSMLKDLRPQGLLVVGTIDEPNLLPRDLPTVFASAVMGETHPFASVHVDDAAALDLICDHLAQQGHQHIGFVGGLGGEVSATRLRAFEAACQKRNLHTRIFKANHSQTEGSRVAQEILASAERPTALVAVNELVAIGLMHTLEQEGARIPRDCALVSFDNTAVARNPRVSITSIDARDKEVGRRSAQLLLDLLEDPDQPPAEILIEPQLVVRNSSTGTFLPPRKA